MYTLHHRDKKQVLETMDFINKNCKKTLSFVSISLSYKNIQKLAAVIEKKVMHIFCHDKFKTFKFMA